MNSRVENFIFNKVLPRITYTHWEIHHALRFLKECKSILDVGCGSGVFIENDPERIEGIEINIKNVEQCTERGLRAKQGSALNIPYPDNSFDGAYCAHVIQIFPYTEAVKLLNELRRVVKPKGVIVLVSFPDHRRLYYTPETFRAYPPHAIRALIKDHSKKYSPSTFSDYVNLKQEAIRLRRPPLVEFEGVRNEFLDKLATLANLLQHKFCLRKYWSYNGYVMKLRNGEK